MKDGILNINKPAGWTSQDVCAKLRGRLHIKKIGHTGTLDPMVTGVLPVCLGKATRIIEYFDNDFKTYHAGMKLGIETDTLDIWGELLSEKSVVIASTDSNCTGIETNPYYESSCNGIETNPYYESNCTGIKTNPYYESNCTGIESHPCSEPIVVREESIKRAFAEYTGRISQIPPKYSALKINGKRAYDLAREGKDFEIKAREITILSNEITKIDYETGEMEFDVTCSKGTYIRTICDDIGRALGCGAVMTSLVRTKSGFFDISDALDLAELIKMSDEDIEKHIVPMDKTLINLGIVTLDDNRLSAFINGNSSGIGYKVIQESNFVNKKDKSAKSEHKTGGNVYKVYNRGNFLGIATIEGRDLMPSKVIKA